VDFRDYDTRLAAYAAIVDDADRILLTWFNGSATSAPCWTMPGGGVEFDESLEDAVVREVMEEAGYVVEVGHLLVTHHWVAPATAERRPYKAQRLVFHATITGGELGTTEVGGSTDFARWHRLSDVPGLEARADIVDVSVAALTARG
jgi:8-oxo-dGTP diphosphatase